MECRSPDDRPNAVNWWAHDASPRCPRPAALPDNSSIRPCPQRNEGCATLKNNYPFAPLNAVPFLAVGVS